MQICRQNLLKTLGLESEKIPADFEKEFENVACPDRLWNTLLVTNVKVCKTVGRSKHRVRVKCLECGRWIPFGRIFQHVDTKRCRENGLRKEQSVCVSNDNRPTEKETVNTAFASS